MTNHWIERDKARFAGIPSFQATPLEKALADEAGIRECPTCAGQMHFDVGVGAYRCTEAGCDTMQTSGGRTF